MRTIPEVVEAVLNILNEAERTEEYNGDTLCEINELMGEILVINSNNERKCEECAGCTNWLCDCANTRAHAIDEFSEQLKVELDKKYSFGIENKFKLFNSIDEIKKQMKL